MFYYAEINSEYQVINKHCLSEESTNPNYILITEDLYTNGNELGDIVGQFYNTLSGVIEIVDPGWDMGQTCWMRYKDSQMRLSTKLDNMDKTISLKADIDHTHEGYANSDDLQVLEDVVATKANTSHTHTEYALVGHTHSNYATQVALDALGVEVDEKANVSHTHSEYATQTSLDSAIATLESEIDDKANANHNHDSNYAPLSHSHTEYVTTSDFNALETEVDGKANENHIHDNYATVSDLNELSSVVSGKANTSHSHNDIYYTETEIDDKLATKADSSHNHTGVYDVNGAAASALSSAQTYTDEAIDALSETVATKADASTLSSHTGNTAVHITSAERSKLSGIAEGANNYVLPSAGTSLGGVKSGGDVTISSGVITVNDDSHNHVISNVDGLQSALDSKAASGHNHDGVYYTETEIDTLLVGKANSSHTHTIANITNLQSTLDGKANASHGTHVSYSTTAPVMDGSASVGTASTVARSDHKHPTDTSRAAQTSLDSHTNNKSNPHGVTLAQLGVTATAAELNALDGITATVTELNYVDGVTSNIQIQLNGKAASSHTHNYAGSSSAGGVATSANKLATARTISLTGDVTGSTSFDGSGNVVITATVADDSHNHTIANIDNLQSALDGKSATSHIHTAESIVQMADALFGTNYLGGVEYSYGSGSGKNVLTEISNMTQGLHTIYAIAGTTGNPKTTESFRYLIHKTSGTIGWILAWDAQGSLFTNYQSAAGTFKGWKCVYDAAPSALWTGGYYMSSSNGTPQTVKPSKKLSECRNGWVLIWSDYDADTSTKNNTDIHHDYVFKKNCAGANWSGQCMLCDIPRYMGSNSQDVDTERRILKAIYIHDDRIEGSYQGSYDERNDVVLRAVYEF